MHNNEYMTSEQMQKNLHIGHQPSSVVVLIDTTVVLQWNSQYN